MGRVHRLCIISGEMINANTYETDEVRGNRMANRFEQSNSYMQTTIKRVLHESPLRLDSRLWMATWRAAHPSAFAHEVRYLQRLVDQPSSIRSLLEDFQAIKRYLQCWMFAFFTVKSLQSVVNTMRIVSERIYLYMCLLV